MKITGLKCSTALIMSLALGCTNAALAQCEEAGEIVADVADATPTAQEPTEITVTGSRIGRKDATSVGPITTLTNEDIAAAAPTSAGEGQDGSSRTHRCTALVSCMASDAPPTMI
jgi:outer membrane receptor protein involved in Fe transport